MVKFLGHLYRFLLLPAAVNVGWHAYWIVSEKDEGLAIAVALVFASWTFSRLVDFLRELNKADEARAS